MLSPYQLENLTRLDNGDLVLLDRKYRTIPHLERLIEMCLVDCYDEIVRGLCVISYEDWLTTAANSNPSRSSSEKIMLDLFYRECDAKSRLPHCQKNNGHLPTSSDECWDNQRRQICWELLRLKWTIVDMHIRFLSLVDEPSYDLEIILDLHQ